MHLQLQLEKEWKWFTSPHHPCIALFANKWRNCELSRSLLAADCCFWFHKIDNTQAFCKSYPWEHAKKSGKFYEHVCNLFKILRAFAKLHPYKVYKPIWNEPKRVQERRKEIEECYKWAVQSWSACYGDICWKQCCNIFYDYGLFHCKDVVS